MKFEESYRPVAPGMGQAVFERTVGRRKEDGSYENWGEVADRVAFGNASLCPEGTRSAEEEYEILRKHLRNGTTLMSGRHLQHGDYNQKLRNMEIYTNCATSACSFLLFYLLLNGSGVGRCYDDDMMLVNWDYAPTLRCVLDTSHPDFDWSSHESKRDALHKYGTGKDVMWHEVGDSREGWAKALELWENAAFEKVHSNKMLILDFSKVRPKGSPIGGMQNRPASGPVALMGAFNKAATLKGSGIAKWRQAMYVDHYFAECVLVGGARRAARMSTKHWSDLTVLDFITVKRPIEYAGMNGEDIVAFRKETTFPPMSFLWSSNNSVTVDDEFWSLVKSDRTDDLALHAKKVFDLVCEASYADGTGEPGFINSHKMVQNDAGWGDLNRGDFVGSAKFQVEDDTQILLSKLAKRAKKKKFHMITNPCVTGDTIVMTALGPKSVLELEGVPFTAIVDGNGYAASGFWSTGIKPVFKVQTKRGNSVRATASHEVLVKTSNVNYQWRRVDQLKAGDKMVLSKYSACDEIASGPYAENFTAEVLSIDPDGVEEVFDCSVADVNRFDANGLIVHNCGEITLNVLGGFCVIADVVPYHANSLSEAEDCFRATTRALMRVNLMDSIYSKEVKRTNRIGVGITGIHEFAWKFFNLGFQDLIDEEKSKAFWLTMARFNRAVNDEAVAYAKELGMNVPHTMTTIKPAGCRPWNALVTTDKGIFTLQELFKNHPSDSQWGEIKEDYAAIQDNGQKSALTKSFSNGEAEVLRINMSYGLSVESTKNHPWFVKSRYLGGAKYVDVNEWIAAEDIKENDIIDVKIGVYKSTEHRKLDKMPTFSLRMRGKENPIIQPTSMNSDLAWLFGYLWGDGAMSPNKYRLRWMDRNLANLEKTNRIMKEQFGISGNIIACNNKEASTLDIGNVELWHWLIRNGVYKYHAKEIDLIPQVVRESSQEDIIAFIAGMVDADGAICGNQNSGDKTISFSQADHQFSKHFQDVSWAVGLAFGMSHNTRKSMYLLTLSSATDENAHRLLVKHSNKMTRADDDTAPWRYDRPNRSLRGIVGKVISVESIGVMPTYDVEVDTNHWFYAGAVKSHNTTSKLFLLTEGWHLPTMREFIRWVQFRSDDPLVADYKAAGYPVRELVTYGGTTIVGFPTAPAITTLGMNEKLVTAAEATPEEQYRWLMLGEKYWINGTDEQGNPVKDAYGNQISYTLKYFPNTVGFNDFKEMMLKYQSEIRCCSVMPQEDTSSYEYLPEQMVSREEYDAVVAQITDASIVQDVGKEHVDCASGGCPVDFQTGSKE